MVTTADGWDHEFSAAENLGAYGTEGEPAVTVEN